MSQDKIVHPMVTLFVNTLQEIAVLGVQARYLDGFRMMRYTICIIKPQDRESVTDLTKRISDHIKFIELSSTQGFNWQRKRLNQIQAESNLHAEYQNCFEALDGLLWKRGYLSDEAYQLKPTADKEKSGENDEEGFGGVLSSEV